MPEWLIPALGLYLTTVSLIGGIAWKQANQFSDMRSSLYNKLEKVEGNILDKLEYHERHDDQRFSDIKNDFWMLRLRLASKEGLLTEEEHANADRQERRNKASSGS